MLRRGAAGNIDVITVDHKPAAAARQSGRRATRFFRRGTQLCVNAWLGFRDENSCATRTCERRLYCVSAPSPRLLLILLGVAACAGRTPCAGRSPGELAGRDIATVFFISKSDDRNRVDYGMRLDHNCVPLADAVFPYWHEFEPKESTHALGAFEERAYGIDEQRLLSRRPDGAEYLIKLKQLDRPITISTFKEADRCIAVAHTKIDNVGTAEFVEAFAQLGGFLSVDYVEVRGRDPHTGARVAERIKP